MIAHILRLTGWEWYKLQRRWMPWILLGIMVLFSPGSLLGRLRRVSYRGL